MTKKELYALLEENKQQFFDASDLIWENPELSLSEHKATEIYLELMKKLGFEVQCPVAGMNTAFTGTYGSGKPVIGILGEYDALAYLSQEAGATTPCPITEGAPGHGCGHNMLGLGSLAAAWAVKKYLEAKGPGSGTVIFYGCPGEEGGAGKAFMARENEFCKLDAALSWHPGAVNEVTTGTNNTSMQIEYTFKGLSAHAAGNPHQGRSALDAVELMNIGVQFLREHMPRTDCLHYAITNSGGISPNVVQPKATVLYMVRSNNVPNTKALLARVDNIAGGAAQMTDTTISRRFIDGTADLVPNETLEKALYENFLDAPAPTYTDEEVAWAAELKKTFPPMDRMPGKGSAHNMEYSNKIAELTDEGQKPINDFVMPFYHSGEQSPGSTDVADVSWQTPTGQISTATWPSGIPGHSWQVVAAGKSSMAHKGLLYAAQVLAATAVDLYEKPDLLEAAKAEFKVMTKAGYICPIEPDAVPVPVEEML